VKRTGRIHRKLPGAAAGSFSPLTTHDARRAERTRGAVGERRGVIAPRSRARATGQRSILAGLDARFRRFLGELDRREGYVQGHSVAVSEVALAIAGELEVPQPKLPALALGALLHDIGKVFIETRVLSKTGPLAPTEAETIRLHTVLGEAFLKPTIADATVLAVVRSHHERWDGDGYPDGLGGFEIPLAARIVATADAFIAMREARPYRRALALDEVFDELVRSAPQQFDGSCVKALIESATRIPDGKAGLAGARA
jgi:putative nucleotidyltransferase with HDIG domain